MLSINVANGSRFPEAVYLMTRRCGHWAIMVPFTFALVASRRNRAVDRCCVDLSSSSFSETAGSYAQLSSSSVVSAFAIAGFDFAAFASGVVAFFAFAAAAAAAARGLIIVGFSDGELAVTGAVVDAGMTAFVVSVAVDGFVVTTGDGVDTTGAFTEGFADCFAAAVVATVVVGVAVGLTTGLFAVVVGCATGFSVEEVVVAATGLVTGTVATEVFD